MASQGSDNSLLICPLCDGNCKVNTDGCQCASHKLQSFLIVLLSLQNLLYCLYSNASHVNLMLMFAKVKCSVKVSMIYVVSLKVSRLHTEVGHNAAVLVSFRNFI